MKRILQIMATSDAAFDGRTFATLGRADKERYIERCHRAVRSLSDVFSGDDAVTAFIDAVENQECSLRDGTAD